MTLVAKARRRLSTPALLWLGAVLGVVALVVMLRTVDGAALADAAGQAAGHPAGVALALGSFALAFALRALAWQRVLPNLGFGQAMAAIHVALGANHVLPFRLGEPLRVLSAVRRTSIGFEAAAASTVTLRAIDLVGVVAIGMAAAPAVYLGVVGIGAAVAVAVFGAVAVAGWWWLRSVADRLPDVHLPGAVTVAAALMAWGAEAVLVWQVAGWAGLDLSASEALVVTTVSVAAQVAAVAPGGLGTYEAAGVAAYVALGHDPEAALVAALGAHALKTIYSITAGAIAVFVPGPALVGRLRLSPPDDEPSPQPAPANAPVVLFMPAFNEEAAVGPCLRRAPDRVAGRPVELVVVDDGSTDATVARAREAGAEVIELGANHGLGAAVRVGLAEGVR
ncbi:MAG: lysylphosphatidylglycerol synthase domain-containing protein, partial [Actinomycetota bacterium]